jgi:ATP-binding cassette, subfamily B, bacterial PglK
MHAIIRELFLQLDDGQKSRFYRLQILVILMSILEVTGIASIGPFMALIGDNELVKSNAILRNFYVLSGADDIQDFISMVGVLILFLMLISSLFSVFTSWRLAIFASDIGTEFSNRLYKYYIENSWLFHTLNNSAQLTKNISVESMRVSDTIIQPLMQMNAKLILALFILIVVVLFNPLVAMFIFFLFLASYFFIYKTIKARLENNGKSISAVAVLRFKLMNEGFGGIRDIILLNKKAQFIDRFVKSSKLYSYSRGTNIALVQVPKYLIELIAFGALVMIMLLLLNLYKGDLGLILPVLSIYALAIFKLLPALQQVFSSISQIRGSIPAYDAIKEDLIKSNNDNRAIVSFKELTFESCIQLKDVCFSYPGNADNVLNNLNITIPKNKSIAIVGPSGSGKSTILDILLTLIPPDSGKILVDNFELNDEFKACWRRQIGFVPQDIFLSESTICENIAFGVPYDDININMINSVIKLAHLDQFINSQKDGIYTKTGERGITLSGGQKQRIGISRALYNEPDILIFDEATSALDGVTEKLIMDAVGEFNGNKTIVIIAHRLKTVKNCDIIYYVENGKVISKGSYNDLIRMNSDFKEMAYHA